MRCKVCGNLASNSPFRSFFRFPKDEERCKRWAELTDLSHVLTEEGYSKFLKSRICSDHFNKEHMRYDSQNKRCLLFNAVPLPYKKHEQKQITNKRNDTTENVALAREWEEILAPTADAGVDYEFQRQMVAHSCRFCGEENGNLINIFGPVGRTLALHIKITYLPIKVCENDADLPLKICRSCTNKVADVYNFFNVCVATEQKFKNIFKTSEKNKKSNATDADDLKAVLLTTHSLRHDYCNIWMQNVGQNEDLVNWKQAPQYACKICNRSFDTMSILSSHEKLHFFQRDEHGYFVCTTCSQSYVKRSAFGVHLRRHSGEKPFQCSYCSRKFHAGHLLRRHSITHKAIKEKFYCATCNKGFTRKTRLSEHVGKCEQLQMYAPNRLKTCVIQIVDKTNENIGELVTTTNDINVSKPHFKCLLCPKSLSTRKGLRKHMGTHSKKSHVCNICYRAFNRKDILKDHIRIHTGERPFACRICGFAFRQKGDCTMHERRHKEELLNKLS